MVHRHAEDTLLDDGTGVHPRHFKIGAVVPGIDRGDVSRINFVGMIGLKVLEIYLVTDLMHDVDVFFGPLIWV